MDSTDILYDASSDQHTRQKLNKHITCIFVAPSSYNTCSQYINIIITSTLKD